MPTQNYPPFDPEHYALLHHWNWHRIVETASIGLALEEAFRIQNQFGPDAPDALITWARQKVAGSCSMAAWEWEMMIEEFRSDPSGDGAGI